MKYSNKAVLAAAIAASTQALATGLALNEQSASSAGSAYAGRASSAANASTLFGNPAGMSRLERAEVSGGLAFIDASTDISDAEGQLAPGLPVSGTNDGDMVPFSTIPFGYYVTPISDKLHAGIGVYAPAWKATTRMAGKVIRRRHQHGAGCHHSAHRQLRLQRSRFCGLWPDHQSHLW